MSILPRSHDMRPPASNPQAGVTLTELMVAMVVMSIGIMGLITSFTSIQKALQLTKNKTLASNLAQEKMQILKQKTYYQVIATPNPSGENTEYSPSIPYDTVYFPPENIREGGVNYERLTYIQVARENSGAIELLPPETPDTGMRQITVTVLWQEGGAKKKLAINSVMANPDTVMSNSVFTGTVKIYGTSTGINGALVNVAENMGWRDTANASGVYSINLSPGNYTLLASAPGYYNQFVTAAVAANASVTQDFSLVPIASGTVSGTAWLNPGLIISQVVAATNTLCGDGANHDVEYVTLYNPTTGPINIAPAGTTASAGKTINIEYRDESSGFNYTDADFTLTHVSSYVAAGKSYLIANATWFYSSGWQAADAYYRPAAGSCGGALYCDVIRNTKAGGIQITPGGSTAVIDKVGWCDDNNNAPIYEGTQVNLASWDGLATGSQIVRITSATASESLSDLLRYGGAYDSGNNSVDFSYRSVMDVPALASTLTSSQTAISGVPAVGAVISANDGLSDPATAYATGTPPRAIFSMTNVATGTWTVLISSGQYLLQNDTVTLVTTGSVYTFPSSTTMLNQAALYGFISGVVTDITGAAISVPSAISLSPGSAGSNQNANTSTGRYLLVVTPGSVDVTANPSNANVNYVSSSSSAISVSLGQISNGVNFALSQGGRLYGYITRDGVNHIPGVAVAALDANGISRDQQVSDSSGRFTTVNIATGTYDLTPSLDSHETSVPATITATVLAGQTVQAGTFTITGALGTISGNVTSGGSPIATGVLIVVTTSTLSGSPAAPPALNSGSLASAAVYNTSSLEDGTYSIDVRQSTNPLYNIYGYYTTISGAGVVTITARTRTAGVLAGATTGQHNLAW